MLTLRLLTFNTAIQNVRFLWRSLYCPVPHTQQRLGRLARALVSVGADVVCLQEMFDRGLQGRLRRELREVYPFAAGLRPGGPWFRLANELLVLSRYPICRSALHRFTSAAAEELRFTCRGFLHTTIRIPALGSIELVNFHATAGGHDDHPESPAMEAIRTRQIRQIREHVAGNSRVLLAGDLNAGPHSSVQNYREILAGGMVDAFEAGGGTGITWDPVNPLVAMGKEAALPPQRIDHVIVSASLAEVLGSAAAEIVLAERIVPSGDGPVPLSDHYGVLVEFRFDSGLCAASGPQKRR